MGGNVKGIRSIIGRHKIDGERSNIGNGEFKELTCATHGHELKGECRRVGGCRAEGEKLGKL